ncbi:dynein axonemal heavy chain 12-like isoform X2 [Rhipicephalus microplus]|uniref:dynein axonemal heavy chain 12-like isoform X2 n=1 Tax=Rhipicephalus microplus TaxID=6941 RepID=UPI003F6B347C
MDFTEVWNNTRSTVSVAIACSDVVALKELIVSGKPVDVQDNRGWRPLHDAVEAGCSVEVLDLLLAHADTDVNWCTFEGETALLLACKRLKGKTLLDIVNKLIGSGADANIADHEGDSPLLAGEDRLIDRGAMDKATPLMIAAQNGHHECVELLLRYGADPNRTTSDNNTGVHLASQSNSILCLRLLLGAIDVKRLLENCLQPFQRENAASSNGANEYEPMISPLHIAIEWSSHDCLRELIKVGFDPNTYLLRVTEPIEQLHRQSHPRYHSALSYAALQGFTATVRILLEAGASPNHISNKCVSPLACALLVPSSQLMRVLIDAGGDLNRLNHTVSRGNPCLQVAVSGEDMLLRVLRMGLDPVLGLCDETSYFKLACCIFHYKKTEQHALNVLETMRYFVTSPSVLQNLVKSCINVGPLWCPLNEERWSAMVESLESPLKLKCLCRVALRKWMHNIHGHYFEERIPEMNIPPAMLNFILYRDMWDIDSALF